MIWDREKKMTPLPPDALARLRQPLGEQHLLLAAHVEARVLRVACGRLRVQRRRRDLQRHNSGGGNRNMDRSVSVGTFLHFFDVENAE